MKNFDTHRFSGAGGAHFGLFGRSLVLREPEDKGAASGGGGTGNPAGEGSGEPATPPAGANDKPKSFTQEEVNRLTAKARNEGREAERKQRPAAPAPPEDGDKPLSMKELKAQLDEEKSRRQFDRRAAKLGLSDDATDDLFTLYQAQKPSDPDAWFETKSKLFAKQGDVSNNPENKTPAPANPDTPKPPAAPRAPSKVDPIAANGLSDIFALTPEAIDQMGPAALREKFEQLISFAQSRSGAPPLPRGPQQRK